MNYWIICLPRLDMEHCIKQKVFGLGRKNLISSVMQGDKIACCAGKGDWKIIAIGESTSDYYVDDQDVFLKKGNYPDRFSFEATSLQKEFDIKTIMEDLSFVTNLAFWAVYFRNGIAKISEADWKMIQKKCKH